MKDVLKTIILEADLNCGIRLSRYLKNRNCDSRVVGNCNTKKKLLLKIDEYKPDFIIMNSQLFFCDIFDMIKTINSQYENLYFIVLTPNYNKKTELLAKNKNITFLKMPYEHYRVYEEIMIKNRLLENKNTHDKIYYFVRSLGINQKFKGFDYLYTAVHIVLFEHDNFIGLTKDIYPEIACRYKSNWRNIERCIRNCIKIYMKNPENKIYIHYLALKYGGLPDEIGIDRFKMTNSKFILLIAEIFRQYYM